MRLTQSKVVYCDRVDSRSLFLCRCSCYPIVRAKSCCRRNVVSSPLQSRGDSVLQQPYRMRSTKTSLRLEKAWCDKKCKYCTVVRHRVQLSVNVTLCSFRCSGTIRLMESRHHVRLHILLACKESNNMKFSWHTGRWVHLINRDPTDWYRVYD